MSPQHSSLASDVAATAAPIDPTKVSISKWRPVEGVLAEALHLDPEDVYGATISKPGNLSVRVGQSPRGRAAPVVLLMYTGDGDELEQCVAAAVNHCADRDLALLFAEGTQGWTLAAILQPPGATVPAALAAAYPAASVISF